MSTSGLHPPAMIGWHVSGSVPSGGMDSASLTDRLILLFLLLFLVALLWFGPQFHSIEMCYSSEYDRYVEKADQLRDGILPRDPFRPLLYPLLSAGFASILGDTFAAARTVSSLAAVLALGVTYLLGIACFGRRAAFAATIALAANSLFILFGLFTTTDMLFSAFGLLTVLYSVRVSQDTSIVPLVLLGICFGLSYFTRYAALALIPSLVIAVAFCPLSSRLHRVRRGIVLLAIIVVSLLPHFVLNTYMFGSPFYNENSTNVMRKVFGADPERTKQPLPSGGIASIILQEPGKALRSAMQTGQTWVAQGMAAYVAGNTQFLPAALFIAALLAGMYAILWELEKKMVVLLAYPVTYFIMICLSMEPLPRLFLPILPVCLLIAVHFMVDKAFDRAIHVGRIVIPAWLPAIVIFVGLLVYGVFPNLSDAAARHPTEELRAARLIERRAGPDTVVLGSFPFMQRYVRYRYYHLIDDGFLAQPRTKAEYFERLLKTAKEKKAEFVIFGRASLGARPADLLTGRDVPSFLKPVFMLDNAAVYRVVPTD